MTRNRSIFLLIFLSAGAVLLALGVLKGPPVTIPEDRVDTEVLPESPEPDPPLLALVLDDFGHNLRNLELLAQMGIPLTLAVLPGLPYSEHVAAFALENQMEVILHLPMEPMEEGVPLEQDTITTKMEIEEIKGLYDSHLASVPGASGVSNHMGSKATADRKVMNVIMSRLRDDGLFFLDSMTTARSVAGEIAAEQGVPYIWRDIFLDNENDAAYIEFQLEKATGLAMEKGSAVALGHDRTGTVEVLSKAVPEAGKKGVRFVPLSYLIEHRKKTDDTGRFQP